MSVDIKLYESVKQRLSWDKIFVSPTPQSNVIREGYRLNIAAEEEEEVKKAKEVLKKAQVVFEDRLATSYSDTVQPGDRTLRVIHPKSVTNLRKLWSEEFQKSPLAKALKKQISRG